jgi:hypothetical protein
MTSETCIQASSEEGDKHVGASLTGSSTHEDAKLIWEAKPRYDPLLFDARSSI